MLAAGGCSLVKQVTIGVILSCHFYSKGSILGQVSLENEAIQGRAESGSWNSIEYTGLWTRFSPDSSIINPTTLTPMLRIFGYLKESHHVALAGPELTHCVVQSPSGLASALSAGVADMFHCAS